MIIGPAVRKLMEVSCCPLDLDAASRECSFSLCWRLACSASGYWLALPLASWSARQGGDGPAASPPIVDQTAPDATPTPSATPASTPLPFYTRFEEAAGIVIKAPESVAPQALQNAQEVVAQMLSGRPGIRDRLASRVAAVAIIPRDAYVTVLPEFSYLSGRLDRNREPYDSFATGGLGGVTGQPVTATSEENILMLPGDPFAGESILHHEFAHAIMNMGFTDEDRERWSTIYEEAVAAGRFRDTFAITLKWTPSSGQR